MRGSGTAWRRQATRNGGGGSSTSSEAWLLRRNRVGASGIGGECSAVASRRLGSRGGSLAPGDEFVEARLQWRRRRGVLGLG
ncbi:hypothetical protein PR202_ga20783 [Eleusine coracana subsp. coracana]|uniref:Uncharacterized protein n=1 Tax=Eleusine coracana subsp. coracana TaxID=191504 RepID=A0AAV5CY08_ELECO|nr:hypothetical protein PR202_ga20783 [Eleusine coracana subsp. coracana]